MVESNLKKNKTQERKYENCLKFLTKIYFEAIAEGKL